MNKFTRKAQTNPKEFKDLFERFNLKENPFPYNPFIEPESSDPKRNGSIFDQRIRNKEFGKFIANFVETPLTGDHNRVGYLLESSFAGRGNGKSALLVNLQNSINQDYADSCSKGLNKAFAVYLKAKSGGLDTKFWQISENILMEICKRKVLEDCLITLRYEILIELNQIKLLGDLKTDQDFLQLLDNAELTKKGVNFSDLHSELKRKLIDTGINAELAASIAHKSNLASDAVAKFVRDQGDAWKKRDLNKFLFDQLVRIFLYAGYNGCYVLLDEFEKIVDYQKPSERIEFAYDVRQNLLEGNYQGALKGFFILILTMHPGTQRLILEAWEKAGINARSPLPSEDTLESPHVIKFDDIRKQDTRSLIEIYLNYYRIDSSDKFKIGIYPFDDDAINIVAEVSKYNAAKILKFCNLAITELANSAKEKIDQAFISDLLNKKKSTPEEDISSNSFLNRDTSPMEDALKGAKIKID